MNTKALLLSAVIAFVCLTPPIATAGPRASTSSIGARGSFSRPTFSSVNRSGMSSMPRLTTMSTRPNFTPRSNIGLSSNNGLNSNRVFTQRFNNPNSQSTTNWTGKNWSGKNSSGNNWSGKNRSGKNWSGNNWHDHHHHHHHRDIVFVDFPFFGYPWWYPYDYGYYAQPAVYDDVAAYGGSLVAQVQTQLARSGYYNGSIDGVMGPATRRAIRAFERAHGLPVDGIIDNQLLGSLGLG